MELLDGDDLLSRLGRRPWSVWSIGQALGRVHARLHGVPAPADLPALRDEVRNRLDSELVPADLRDSALARLGDLPDGAQLCHGDFHPANLLRAGDGYAVIDWTLGARGHPAADVARTRLLIAQAGIPADAPRAVRWLARLGRRILLSAYVRGYRKERSLDLKLVGRWAPVLATVRLADDIPEERAGLLAELR
jgi:aminoglycoside phosphotransferase (APT) family kinase protein